jgi:rhodanese-related sulfurtransferase
MGWTEVTSMSGGFGAWKEAGYAIVEGLPPAGEALNGFTPNNAIQTKVSAALANLPEGWGVLPAEALNEEIVEGTELVIIDVRKQPELDEIGWIEGAVHIQLEEMINNKDMWPAMDANIVVYCKAGTRGNIAATILRTYGYQNVRNLKGGITAWIDAGFPVVME